MAILASIIIVLLLFKFLYEEKIAFVLGYLIIFPSLLPKYLLEIGITPFGHATRFVIMVIVLFIYYYRYSGFRSIADSSVRNALLLMLLAVVFANLMSPYKFESGFKDFVEQIIYSTVLPLILTIMILNHPLFLKQFIRSINVWAIVFIFYNLFFIDFSQIDYGDRRTYTEASGFDTIGASRIFAIIFILNVVELVRKSKWYNIFLILVSLFFILLTGQRGTILGTGLATLVFVVFGQREYTKVALFGGLVAIGAYFAILEIGVQDFQVFNRFEELEIYEEIGRYYDYSRSFLIFRENYFLFGEGSHGYFFLTQRQYPHSILLETIVEYGLLGMIGLFTLIFIGVRSTYGILRVKTLSFEYSAVACIWIMIMMSVLVSGSYSTNVMFFAFTILVANVFNEVKRMQHIAKA